MRGHGLTPPPDILDERALTIYVDGSMRNAPRRGGIGIHFVWVNSEGNEETWDHSLPAALGATNNEMELEAPTEALRLASSRGTPFDLAQFNKIVIRTDSEYVHGNWKTAAWTWSKTKWMKVGGAAVINSDAWKALIREMKGMSDRHGLRVHIEWAKGKKGIHANIVDKLAKQSSDSPASREIRPGLVRRKVTTAQVEPGSIRMAGQVTTIRVIVAQYLRRPHKSYRYKYEVVRIGDPDHGKVDWAQSDLNLAGAHTYIVRMNDQQDNPRIQELLEEVVEDLTPYLDALKALGQPSTVRQVVQQLGSATGLVVTVDAAKRRLDQLVESGQVFPTRSKAVGRPYLYQLPGVAAEWHGDA